MGKEGEMMKKMLVLVVVVKKCGGGWLVVWSDVVKSWFLVFFLLLDEFVDFLWMMEIGFVLELMLMILFLGICLLNYFVSLVVVFCVFFGY